MNDLPDVCCRLARRVIALLFAAALAACGPGSGGTGTGPIALLFSGSSTVSTVGGSTVGVPVPVVPSTGPARFDLNLQNQSVELTTDCGRFVFTGDWNLNAAGTLVLPGQFQASGSTTLATLRLEFPLAPADSRQVTLTLLNASGQVIAGPVTLSRADTFAPRASAGCS